MPQNHHKFPMQNLAFRAIIGFYGGNYGEGKILTMLSFVTIRVSPR